MEKTCRTLLTALAALTAFAGCRTVEQEQPEPVQKTVRFLASAGTETRTAFAEAVDGIYQTLWTENDSDVLLSLNYGTAGNASVHASADGTTATFEAAFDPSATTAPYTFRAVSPAAAARAISPSRKAWSVSIAADQTPLPHSVDEAAQLLVAQSAASPTLPDEVNLHFSHLTAYGRITLKNLELGGATVDKVDLIFSTPVVGEWYWGEDGTLVSNGASHTITLHTDATDDLWFACAPVDVSGKTLQLVLRTTDSSTLTKEVTFPEGRSFTSGKVARFSVDMEGIEPQSYDNLYSLVTDVSVLSEGDKILIVNTDGTYALGGQDNEGTAHRKQEAVTVKDGYVTDPGAATVLTVKPGSNTGTWSLHTGTGYLASASTKNVLQESASVDAYSSWTISISGSVATIVAGSGEARYIRYNSSASRFSCYKESVTNMKDVSIYRLSEGGAGVQDDPLVESDALGCYLPGFEWTYAPGVDQIARTYTGGKVAFSLLNAGRKAQLVVSEYDPSLVKGDRTKVTVQYRQGSAVLLDRTYTLTVVREDGSKVWLGDGSGQGLIIKK